MTNSSEDSSSPAANPQLPTSEAAECEEGLRRVLAYICEKRHRRWSAFALVFLVIYAIFEMVISNMFSFFVVLPAATGWYDLLEVIPESRSLGVLLFLAKFPLPIVLTLVVFIRMNKVYRAS